MKRQHVALPGLKSLAAAILVARVAEGAKTYCADQNNVVVADANCDGTKPADTFFMFFSEEDSIPVGSAVDPLKTDLYDSTDPIERQNARFPFEVDEAKFETRDMEPGGFGRRACGGSGGGRVGGGYIGRPIGGGYYGG
ncbi:hypothetical protein COL5a_011234 [Colletotrichum fioriniae]|uniref:uncharacterized protein n=1 Tax=Colletotrichum fioriniae TaxID=710243 RepID=UPI0023001A3F|nr:uncharacterized protein COL516b_009639 [Colletotrichum fioriniae]KAJ0298837.1 hypothetical protein COL516b_009639 [Colletotrichum fioriniae]KAJ0317257.1 hypothetical protein COL5a_011234 [Colletotrichum fioriniae]KAJ3942349.1 hypothetical protein N0V96_007847 [Colletotrichum fioriniae]